MNIENGFWKQARERRGLFRARDLAIVADRAHVDAMPEQERFLLDAPAPARIIRGGRVGLRFALPERRRGRRQRAALTVWVNPDGMTPDVVWRLARVLDGVLVPVRRLDGSFRVTAGDLAALHGVLL